MSRKKIIIIASLIAVFLIAGIVLIQNKKQSKKIDNKYFSYEVGTNTFESYIEADGSVKSDNTKKIYVQQSLQVDKVLVKLGDYVKKGQVLLTFNSSDRDEVIRNIAKESANLSQLERNYNSYKKLYAAGGAARIDYQTIETSIQQSRIAIAQYRANLDKMPIDIISPVDGTITALTADENYRVNTQVNLLEIEDLTNVYVSTQVPEYSIKNLAVGQKAEVTLKSSDKKYQGTVTEVSTVSSDSSTDTAAYVDVKVKVDATQLDKNFIPGFKASVKIITSSKQNVLSIPRTSIGEDEQGNKYVWKIVNGTVKKIIIKVGESNQDLIEILSGIAKGDKILEIMSTTLKDGQKLKITDKAEFMKQNKEGLDNTMSKSKTSGDAGGPPK
ncbi:MAG: efflux RND transporter periplasmic adaptor subunit [Leptotrichiaceae bacterium]